MKKYLKGRIHSDTLHNHTSASGKAFYVSIWDGRWVSHERENHVWLPLSQVEIGEPNECGWCEILVPLWLFTKNRINYDRIEEISWTALVNA